MRGPVLSALLWVCLLSTLTFVSEALPTTIPTRPMWGDPPPWHRTIIFLEKRTEDYQYLFFRGGAQNCKSCEIPIRHNFPRMRIEIPPRKAWKNGDRNLDWNGAEDGQGTWNGEIAEGSPGIWTTNDTHHVLYHPLNKYGDNYWLLDVEMNCNSTNNDLFDFKAYVSNRHRPMERDILENSCIGPYAVNQTTHVGVCGFINVFHWESSQCTLDTFERKVYQSDSGIAGTDD